MSEYCPGAIQAPQPGGGALDATLPARTVWHITWDALRADGSQPEFSAVSGYLQNVAFCPHIMWNPFTGYMEQYYPASQSARALAAWNQDGEVCIQIEVFFTPGCVVDGVRYETVADTPLKGFDTLLRWLDSLGIPRVWPMGAPQWQGNSRDVGIWNSQGGHYGHCNVPDNTHTDPGPMPALTRIITQSGGAASGPAPIKKESEMPVSKRVDSTFKARHRLPKGKAYTLSQADNGTSANFAVNGVGHYLIHNYIRGEGLLPGQRIKAQYFLTKGGKPSGHFEQDIIGTIDGTFDHPVVLNRAIEAGTVITCLLTSSNTETAYITGFGAEVTTWKAA